MFVVGARPQFIKSAPVIQELLRRDRRVNLTIVHSGQHYDPEMSRIFFRELRIPKPSLNLNAGSGSHATQTATIMRGVERAIAAKRPDLVVVPGDTNTTLAAALTAAKLQVPVAHVEAGLRSGDFTMPEEINRLLTDHCSILNFAPTRTAVGNLSSEGLSDSIRFTGDTMVDAMRLVAPEVRDMEKSILARFDSLGFGYVLVTLHRPSNVDGLDRLEEIRRALRKVALKMKVIFLVHPRTRARLAKLGRKGSPEKLPLVEAKPQGYVETLALLKNAACLLTDSGGMQKEAFLLHTPCLTLRNTTEWPETLTGKANRLITNPNQVPSAIIKIAGNEKVRRNISEFKNPFGDGHASTRVARLIEHAVTAKSPPL
jgi:UDP-N-acetylglucosamine 2-epimerase